MSILNQKSAAISKFNHKHTDATTFISSEIKSLSINSILSRISTKQGPHDQYRTSGVVTRKINQPRAHTKSSKDSSATGPLSATKPIPNNSSSTLQPRPARQDAKMCRTTLHKSSTCLHSWFTLDGACAPDRNFRTCSSFIDGQFRRHLCKGPVARCANACPVCNGKGEYDGDLLRMVASVEFTWSMNELESVAVLPGTKAVCREVVIVQSPQAASVAGVACCVM